MLRTLLAATAVFALTACGPSEAPSPDAPSITPNPSASATPTPAPAGLTPEQITAALAALPAPYNTADYDAGRRVFAQCRSCHTIDEGAGNRVGPNLHAVFGREIGSAPGFNYSQAVQDANFTWDADHLDHWLANPSSFLPGNRMAFAGVRDETQRRNVIAYLIVETGQ
jgi:cytochrome c